MTNLDDEPLEAYLKRFRPLAPEPLPLKASTHRTPRAAVLWAATIAAMAVFLGAVALHIYTKRVRVTEDPGNVGSPIPLMGGQPLTMRSANALMAKATSYKALVDDMAFRWQAMPLPNGKCSAVAALGKEKVKL